VTQFQPYVEIAALQGKWSRKNGRKRPQSATRAVAWEGVENVVERAAEALVMEGVAVLLEQLATVVAAAAAMGEALARRQCTGARSEYPTPVCRRPASASWRC